MVHGGRESNTAGLPSALSTDFVTPLQKGIFRVTRRHILTSRRNRPVYRLFGKKTVMYRFHFCRLETLFTAVKTTRLTHVSPNNDYIRELPTTFFFGGGGKTILQALIVEFNVVAPPQTKFVHGVHAICLYVLKKNIYIYIKKPRQIGLRSFCFPVHGQWA